MHLAGALRQGITSSWMLYIASLDMWVLVCLRCFTADGVVQVALPVWRGSVDRAVRAHAKEHREYLKQKGFFRNTAGSSSSS